jgi:hypothetical protein
MTKSTSKTPRTDAVEQFIWYDVPNYIADPMVYAPARKSIKPPVGFVSSDFARKLELEIAQLQELIQKNSNT